MKIVLINLLLVLLWTAVPVFGLFLLMARRIGQKRCRGYLVEEGHDPVE